MKTPALQLALAAFALSAAPLWAADSGKLSLVGRAVPQVAQLPDDHYGRLARYGHELATRTFAHIGPEVRDRRMRYAGNNLACASCHQESATKPYAMPWVGVAASFPQYRGREDEISTVEDRVNGCMQRSMNGKPLPMDSREMKAFVTYIHYLSQGVPVGAQLEGAGTKNSKAPKAPPHCRARCPTAAPPPRQASRSMPRNAPSATARKARACAPASGAMRWATSSRPCGARTVSTTARG